jgi:hypothetical protein
MDGMWGREARNKISKKNRAGKYETKWRKR